MNLKNKNHKQKGNDLLQKTIKKESMAPKDCFEECCKDSKTR